MGGGPNVSRGGGDLRAQCIGKDGFERGGWPNHSPRHGAARGEGGRGPEARYGRGSVWEGEDAPLPGARSEKVKWDVWESFSKRRNQCIKRRSIQTIDPERQVCPRRKVRPLGKDLGEGTIGSQLPGVLLWIGGDDKKEPTDSQTGQRL